MENPEKQPNKGIKSAEVTSQKVVAAWTWVLQYRDCQGAAKYPMESVQKAAC